MWTTALMLLVLTAAVARAQTADGCPGDGFSPVADGLCLLVTPPLGRDEAARRCYLAADRHVATAWQLRTDNSTLFRLVREALLRAGARRVWLEARLAYPGGMFLHGFPGNSLYNSPVWGLDLPPDRPQGECLAWDVDPMRHLARDCADALPAACLARLSTPRLEMAGCPQGFRLAARSRACLAHTVVEQGGLAWREAVDRCAETAPGASLVQRGFPALHGESLARSFYSCPLGARLLGGTPVWTDAEGQPDASEPVEQQYLKKLLGGSDEADADLVGQVYLYNTIRYLVKPFGPQWRLVDANTTFNCLACEAPLPPPKKPVITLRLAVDEARIIAQVENPEYLIRTTSWSWSGDNSSVRLVPKLRCFTDALTFYPVEVYHSSVEPHQVVLSPVGDGVYWCIGYDVFTTEPIFSDKLLVRSFQEGLKTFAVQLRVSEPKTLVCEKFHLLREFIRIKQHIQGVFEGSGNLSDPTPGDSAKTLPDGLGPRYRFVYPYVHAGDTLAVTLFDDRAQGRIRRIGWDCTTMLLHVKAPRDSHVAPSIAVDGFYYSVTSARSVDSCDENITDYKWPETIAGETAVLMIPNGAVKRTCEIDFDTGAFWGKEIFAPLPQSEDSTTIISEPSNIVSTSTYNSSSTDNTIMMFSTASPSTAVSKGPTPASQSKFEEVRKSVEAADDLHKLSKAELNTTGLYKAVNIINDILEGNMDDMIDRSSRPTTMLHDVKTILSNVLLEGDEFKVVQPKIAVFVADIQKNEMDPIRSMILTGRDTDAEGSLNGSIETGLGEGASSDISQRKDIDVAVLLPDFEKDARISVAIYSDSRAFRMRDLASVQNVSVNSHIVSIDINSEENGTIIDEENAIHIYFRPFENHSEGEIKQCVFWEFKQGYEGRWSSDGCKLVNSSGGLDVCRCHHLTHFAEIITSGGPPISKGHQLSLEVISMVGCSLSLAGVVGIVATAVIFPAWRRQLGNKLLLCLSGSVALNMIMFLLIAIGSAKEGVWCIVAGVGLHYSLLASFCWMLVSAWLQYRRLVEVLVTQHVSHLILKVSVFSWGFPSVIIIILLSIDPNIYTTTSDSGTERGFCFPTGHFFYWGVLAPVVLVVVVNIFIFFAILKSIYNCCSTGTVEKRGFSKRHLNNRRLLTGVLLFFLLGLTWVFGFLARVSIVFTYLFCVTATMQGMVLFLFFIAGEKKLREKWFPRESSATYSSSTRSRRQTLVANSTTGTYATSSSTTDETTPLKGSIPLSQMTKITEW
ncbi:uncharacterized protein LOC134542960 [Bacillus rossius redtenbacheri]|uniref:uncharacterized protein LOC134542960 n=1 Tax=Bacillus rossius redtenbacheri TaxID=93214 RepID=UPI002FDE9C13